CDAMKLAIQAGMDLPAAVQLSVDLVGSPALKRDGQIIVAQLSSGQDIDKIPGRLSVLPLTVLAVVQLSADRSDLPASLDTIAAMYQQQAEMRLASVQSILAPLLILGVALIIGFVIVALFAPIVSLFRLF